MKTRFGRALIAILSVAALAVGLSSCSWLLSLFDTNTDPTVSLSVNDSTLYSDQIATFTASGYDADGDSLTYTWYVNDTLISGSDTVQSRYWLTDYTTYPEVYVIVDDGFGGSATSNTVSMTISPAASFRVVNTSGITVYYVQISTNSGSSWSADYLGSSTLPSGYTLRILGLTGDYYYAIRAMDSSYGAWTSGNVMMYDGYYRNFTLTASSWNMSSYSNAYSMADPRALSLPGLSGAKLVSAEMLAPKVADAAAFNPNIGPVSAEESDPDHDPALGFGVQF